MPRKLNNKTNEDIVVPVYCGVCQFDGTENCPYLENNMIVSCDTGRPTQQAIEWGFQYVFKMLGKTMIEDVKNSLMSVLRG